jgi:hypothetical protein
VNVGDGKGRRKAPRIVRTPVLRPGRIAAGQPGEWSMANGCLPLSGNCLLSPDPFATTSWLRWLRSPVLSPAFPAGCVYRDNVLRPCYNLGSIKADYKHANARPCFTGLRRLPAAPTWSFRVERTCLPRPWRGLFLKGSAFAACSSKLSRFGGDADEGAGNRWNVSLPVAFLFPLQSGCCTSHPCSSLSGSLR